MNWYVSCGCPGHGDHLGCSKGCVDHGCAHPLGLDIAVPTEAEADALSDKPLPAEIVVKAAYVAMNRIQRKADKKIARLHRIAAEYTEAS